MLVQKSVFSEDVPVESFETIKKYFPDAIAVRAEDILTSSFKIQYNGLFRGSLNLAYLFKQTRPWTNALEWLPPFRHNALNGIAYFTDFTRIKDHIQVECNRYESKSLFVRPASGYKEFSGNIYTPEKLKIEYDFAVQNKNIDPYIICMIAPPEEIFEEWRLVFIDHKFVDGCRYMAQGELSIKSELPNEVKTFGEYLSRFPFFQNRFNWCLDLCSCKYGLKLLEVNAFETSSFYACDLDKIYSTLAKEYER